MRSYTPTQRELDYAFRRSSLKALQEHVFAMERSRNNYLLIPYKYIKAVGPERAMLLVALIDGEVETGEPGVPTNYAKQILGMKEKQQIKLAQQMIHMGLLSASGLVQYDEVMALLLEEGR